MTQEEQAAHVKKMGRGRQATLTPVERTALAKKAAQARWSKKKKSGKSAPEKKQPKPTSGA